MKAPAAALAALATLALAGVAAAGSLPGGRALAVHASLSQSTHLFGDSVLATVDVVADTGEFQPERLRAELAFGPYEAAGGVREERRRTGGVLHVRYQATLRCLHVGCLAPREQSALGGQEEGRAERHTIVLPPARVLYRGADGRDTVLLVGHFPPLQVISRLNTSAQLERGGTFAASLEPPGPTYRLRPAGIAALALAAAALLALLPAALAARRLRARLRERRRWRPLPPLERALTLVEWTARQENGAEDRRKALESLAVVLDERGECELAESARRAAWAEAPPEGERAGALGREARTATGGVDGRPA